MSSLNNIEQIINDDMRACVESNYNFWKFKPRRHYEPECLLKAKQKYWPQLQAALSESNAESALLNQATFNALNQKTNIWNALFAILVVSIVLYFIFKN